LLPNYCVLDDFLDAAALDELRRHARAERARFKPSETRAEGVGGYDGSTRQSLRCRIRKGELAAFREAVVAATPELFHALRIPPEPITSHELEMVAHGNRAFFKRHVDTFVGRNREGEPSDRLISAVFYFDLGAKRFSGGELVLNSFVSGGEEAVIAPTNNRLLAFPSFAAHEVRPVEVAEDTFENARFAVNCWLHRGARPAQ
jgi:Rps23 Pro-64 3,4-dihydroxylase Tpa1-like proline 4-hydroxylase